MESVKNITYKNQIHIFLLHIKNDTILIKHYFL